MTDIKTLVRKLLAGKLPAERDAGTLAAARRHAIHAARMGSLRKTRRRRPPARKPYWERIVARTMPHEKNPAEGKGGYAPHGLAGAPPPSIMLAIGAGLTLVNLLWRPAPEIIHTNSGNQSTEQVALPDGSTLWLEPTPRAGTPRIFRAGERRVELNGQGFFEVAEDPPTGISRPLCTQWIDVTALGTAFGSLFPISGAGNAEATLRNGSVRVSPPGVTKQPHALARPEIHLLRRHTQSDRQPVDAQRYTLWHERMSLSFENQPPVGHPAAPRKMVQLPYRLSRRDRDTLPLHVLAERRDTRPHLAASPILDSTRHRLSTDATVCTCASTKNKKEPETTRPMKKNRRYG